VPAFRAAAAAATDDGRYGDHAAQRELAELKAEQVRLAAELSELKALVGRLASELGVS
jgi:hypothetical protein